MFHRLLNLLCLQPLELRAAASGRGIGPEHRAFIDGLARHMKATSSAPAAPAAHGRQYAPQDFHSRPFTATSSINEYRQKNHLPPIYTYDHATRVVTLDICGPLALHASLFEMDCMDVCSYDHVNAALLEIPTAHTSAVATVLNINSPGGQSRGSQATADFVAQLAQRMPVVAYSDDLMCSAAMRIAAPATEIHTSSDAEIGSIGTIIAFLDDSEYLSNLGINWEVIASGDLKGIGNGPLTEVQRAHLQASVDANADRFKSHMLKYRPGLTASDMRGQSFNASAAPAALIDSNALPTLSHAQAYAADRFRK